MKNFTNDDYLRLLEELDGDYDDDDYGSESDFVWIPADPLYKKKIKSPGSGGIIDLSNVKKNNLKDTLYKGTVFKIGIFTIRITKYSSEPNKNDKSQDLKLDLSFLHEVTKTPSGNSCKMDYKFEIAKDSRFSKCSWLTYLATASTMKNVPIQDVIEIIRWFQSVHRMTAFI